MLHFGLALKRIKLLKGKKRNRPYVVVYSGMSAALRDGHPLVTASRLLEGAKVGEELIFDGLGLLLLPPRPIDHEETLGGGLASWHIEVWRSRENRRNVGEFLSQASTRADFGSPLARAVSQVNPVIPVVATALKAIARPIGVLLASGGDKLIANWSGSLYRDQLEGLSGSELHKKDEDVEVTFVLLGTEGPEPEEMTPE